MNLLFLHQNFPGQFKHLAPALAAQGHRVLALTLQNVPPGRWQGDAANVKLQTELEFSFVCVSY